MANLEKEVLLKIKSILDDSGLKQAESAAKGTAASVEDVGKKAKLAGRGGIMGMVKALLNGDKAAAAMALKMTGIVVAVTAGIKAVRYFGSAIAESMKANSDSSKKAAEEWAKLKSYIGDSLVSALQLNSVFNTTGTIAASIANVFRMTGNLINSIGKAIVSAIIVPIEMTYALLAPFSDTFKDLQNQMATLRYGFADAAIEDFKDIFSWDSEILKNQKDNYAEIKNQLKSKKEEIKLLKEQRRLLSEIGLSEGKDLKGWDRGNESTEPKLSTGQILSGEDGSAGIFSSFEQIDAERARIEQLYNDKKAFLDKNITDETLHKEALINLDEQAANQRIKLSQTEAKTRQSVMGNMWSALTALAGHSNESIAKIGKVAGIVQGTIGMIAGAASALKDVPYPYNIAVAVPTVLAQGAMLIDQLKNLNTDSGGGVTAVSGGVPSVTGSASDINSQMQNFGVSGVNRNISGQDAAGAVPITINFNATGGVEAFAIEITDAIRNGVVEATQMSNIVVKDGTYNTELAI